MTPERPPAPILGAALIAIGIAGYDVVVTILALLRPEGTGAVVGTFLRDALLLVAAVMLLRRAAWAGWVLGALFGLSLLRVLAPSDPVSLAVNALALVGIALLAASYRWWAGGTKAS